MGASGEEVTLPAAGFSAACVGNAANLVCGAWKLGGSGTRRGEPRSVALQLRPYNVGK